MLAKPEEISLLDTVLSVVKKGKEESNWDRAMKDIFVFIRNFVPKALFDLGQANPQQIRILKDLQGGTRNFIARAPRKGGKTILVAVIICWLALSRKLRICVVAGSLEQAKWLYRYCNTILTGHKLIRRFLKGEPTQTWTNFTTPAFIVCVPASSKQVNAPTVDVVVLEEYVLIDPDIITEAWPMNRSSPTPMRFILSTALDKISLDSFLDIFDRAEELGFESYWWDDSQCPWLSKTESHIAERVFDPETYQIHWKGGVPLKRGMVFPRVPLLKAFKKEKDLPEDYYVPKGPVKVGIDWGFAHDTVFLAGYLDLKNEINLFRVSVFSKTDDEELADTAVEWDTELYTKFGQRVDQWLTDSAGAFQNSMMRKKGLWTTPRVFGHRRKGKEWMIGIVEWYLRNEKMNIPDTREFRVLKRQARAYKRDKLGHPIKGYDDHVDTLMCLCSGWDPSREAEAPRYRPQPADRILEREWRPTEWEEKKVGDEIWKPPHWEKMKWPWEE